MQLELSNQPVLRNAKLNDLYEITWLNKKLSLKDVQKIWKDEKLFYVYEQDIIKGYIVASLHDDYIEVDDIFVDYIYRRMGIGTELMASLLYDLVDFNKKYIKMTVDVRALNLQLFLKEMGFVGHTKDEQNYEFVFKPMGLK